MAFEVTDTLTYVVELLGIAAFAWGGAFQAVRADLGLFGTALLAASVGLGGGLIRDLILGLRPVAFDDLGYFCTPVLVAVVVFFGHGVANDHRVAKGWVLDVCDAAAVGIASRAPTPPRMVDQTSRDKKLKVPDRPTVVPTTRGWTMLCKMMLRMQ